MPSWLALTPWTLSGVGQACNSLSGNEREGTYFDRVVSKQNCVTILNYLQSIHGDSIFCLAPVHTAEFSAVLSRVKGAPRWTSSTMTPNAVTSACKYNFGRPATLLPLDFKWLADRASDRGTLALGCCCRPHMWFVMFVTLLTWVMLWLTWCWAAQLLPYTLCWVPPITHTHTHLWGFAFDLFIRSGSRTWELALPCPNLGSVSYGRRRREKRKDPNEEGIG